MLGLTIRVRFFDTVGFVVSANCETLFVIVFLNFLLLIGLNLLIVLFLSLNITLLEFCCYVVATCVCELFDFVAVVVFMSVFILLFCSSVSD